MDFEHIVAITIAIISSTAFTSFITLWFSRRKTKAEAKVAEVGVVTAKIDQADKIVTIATNLLEDVRDERNKLAKDKKELEALNDKLTDALTKCKDQLKKAKEKDIPAVKTVLAPAKKAAKKAATPKKK